MNEEEERLNDGGGIGDLALRAAGAARPDDGLAAGGAPSAQVNGAALPAAPGSVQADPARATVERAFTEAFPGRAIPKFGEGATAEAGIFGNPFRADAQGGSGFSFRLGTDGGFSDPSFGSVPGSGRRMSDYERGLRSVAERFGVLANEAVAAMNAGGAARQEPKALSAMAYEPKARRDARRSVLGGNINASTVGLFGSQSDEDDPWGGGGF